MAYLVEFGNKFLKDAKKMEKRGSNIAELKTAVEYLEKTGTLPSITSQKYKAHKLTGNFAHHWEGHIKPDWLIIWLVDESNKTVTLVRTGTHADLF